LSSVAQPVARPLRRRRDATLSLGVTTGYLSVIVLIPLAALVLRSTEGGAQAFWDAVTDPQAIASLRITFLISLVVVAINAVAGTVIAWVLVRDSFPGKSVVAYTTAALVLALLFVTLPFVVRTVQPVLLELDREMEEAAQSLGATPFQTFRRIVFPNLFPAILSGTALGFARSLGEFGSVVLISGNLPFKTEVASVYIFGQIESDNITGAAAVSVVLLVASLAVLLAIGGVRRWATRHDN
jgi:sulfate/thiosulfate transport system permease protein